MLKVGIVGFGRMGRLRAVTLAKDGRARVVKVFDPVRDDALPVAWAASAEEVLDDPGLDAVFVCATNDVNEPFVIRALGRGKHVFCEKPPAFNAAGVQRIIAAERAAGRVLMYGFNHRHHGAVRRMHEEVHGGAYGRVLWMRGRYGKSVDASYLGTWRADAKRAGGGILLDQGIHMLDLFLHVGGQAFDEVHAFVSSRYWNTPGIEDNVFAIMRHRGSGLEASLHSTMTQWRHLFSLEVFLERGYLVLNGLKTQSGTYGEEELTIARNRTVAPAATFESEERIHFAVNTSWQSEATHFLDAVTAGRPVEYGTSAQALAVMSLIDRIYENDRAEHATLHERLQGAAE